MQREEVDESYDNRERTSYRKWFPSTSKGRHRAHPARTIAQSHEGEGAEDAIGGTEHTSRGGGGTAPVSPRPRGARPRSAAERYPAGCNGEAHRSALPHPGWALSDDSRTRAVPASLAFLAVGLTCAFSSSPPVSCCSGCSATTSGSAS